MKSMLCRLQGNTFKARAYTLHCILYKCMIWIYARVGFFVFQGSFTECLCLYVLYWIICCYSKKQLTMQITHEVPLVAPPARPMWASVRFSCLLLLALKQNKWFLKTYGCFLIIYLGLEMSCATLWSFFYSWMCNKEISSKVTALTNHKNRPTPVISLQLPAIIVRLGNKMFLF